MEKTIQDRLTEVVSIRRKLDVLGLTKAIHEIEEFQAILSQYVRDGEPCSGHIRIPDTNRILKYILPKKARHQCSVTLAYCK